jgi:hypothetical protein
LRVTPRGRDYLQATILLGILALILDTNVMLALALTLAIIALISFLIVRSISTFNTKLFFETSQLSCFKGEKVTTKVSVQLKRARWIAASVRSVDPPPGVESAYAVVDENTISVTMKSRYAGRFERFLLHLQVTDILNLFSKEVAAVYADFRLDSLPISLLSPIPRTKPMPLTLGERSLHSPGSSLELYALDEYHPFSETKNVLWKRVARMPDERLMVRIRESSIPRTIQIGFIQVPDRFKDLTSSLKNEESQAKQVAELKWKDLTCEGLGAIGNNILAIGCKMEIVHTGTGDYTSSKIYPIPGLGLVEVVEDLSDLTSALMNLWGEPDNGPGNERLLRVADQADLVACGLRDLSDPRIANAVGRKPALLISEEWTDPAFVGNQAMLYTGIEDVKGLVSKVVER